MLLDIIKFRKSFQKKFTWGCEKFFSEIIGYIVIQISVYELYPMIYSKLKFENLINYLFKELQSNLSFEFETFQFFNGFISDNKLL